MAIPVASRWWMLTLLIVGVLLLISALALDRPNVVWQGHKPHCPRCRHQVEDYSNRCGDCDSDFDWTVAGDDESPISTDSLSVFEAEWVHERAETLGLETAARRVAEFTGLSESAAAEYVQTVGRGDCGWCGGTKKDLGIEESAPQQGCPCCFGTGQSVACDGDRHVRIGDPTARRALLSYQAKLGDLMRGEAVAPRREEEARRLAEEFLAVHAGTQEAALVVFWQDLRNMTATNGGAPSLRTVTSVARSRLDLVIKALRDEP